jgi:glycine/sarcosine/betaine reductase complex component A
MTRGATAPPGRSEPRGVWGHIGAPTYKERSHGMELRGKKVIALGERDGVPGPAVAECARQAGAEVVLTLTACYV